jgi:transcriptional regulator with XRE-family HTH domain
MTVLLREAIGDRLRHARTNQRRTLRDISRAARVSLGYLSEVERGQKEASSELLASICDALELPLAELLHNVAADVSALDNVEVVPVGRPAERVSRSGSDGASGPSVAKASAGGGYSGGARVPNVLGAGLGELDDLNSLADLRISPSVRRGTTLRTTISAPKMASIIAA